jgi:hypothetical protein
LQVQARNVLQHSWGGKRLNQKCVTANIALQPFFGLAGLLLTGCFLAFLTGFRLASPSNNANSLATRLLPVYDNYYQNHE